ncbi:MAG: SMC-Scp complex subunit ScpB [Smithellaceae bacterium]
MENLQAIIEALVLASETPLTFERLCVILEGVEKTEIQDALDKLALDYEARQSGIGLKEVAGGYQFRTQPEFAPWLKKLKGGKPASLSPAALETLAIVAYRQPIVKAEIEGIRGVDVSGPLKHLMDKKLVRMVGRKDVPGKPIIYGTTKKFLEVFNLKELADLPTMRELKEMTEHPEPVEYALPEIESLEQDLFADDAFEEDLIEHLDHESPGAAANSAKSPDPGPTADDAVLRMTENHESVDAEPFGTESSEPDLSVRDIVVEDENVS